MFKKIIALILVIMLSAVIVSCSTSTSDTPPASDSDTPPASDSDTTSEQPKVIIKAVWNEPLDPDSHPASLAMNIMKTEIESAGVNMTMELYPSGQLGDAASHLKQIQDGVVQMGMSIGAGQFASQYGMKDYYMFDLPYLFSDYDDVVKVYTESPTIKELYKETAEKIGIMPMFTRCEGFRVTTNSKREIRSPEDFKGLKIRTMQNEAHMAMMEALGALPTPVAYPELYSALQTGVVDGQENPPLNIALQKFNEVQKYLTLDNHITSGTGSYVNAEFYNSLTEEQRAVFDAAGKKAAAASTEKAKKDNEAAIQSLKDAGMEVYTPTEEEYAQFKEATVDAVAAYIRKEMDNPERLDSFLKDVETILEK